MTTYVFYHANCTDGIFSAWAANRALKDNAKYVAMTHITELPELVKGDTAYFVDYSKPAKELYALVDAGVDVIVLDHHKTFFEDLTNGRSISFSLSDDKAYYRHSAQGDHGNCFEVVYSPVNSGALTTWYYFFGDLKPPVLLEHVSDRDTWAFKLDGTKEVHAAVSSYPSTFETIDELVKLDIIQLKNMGTDLLRLQQRMVEAICADDKVMFKDLGDGGVPCVNTNCLISEVGAYLVAKYPFLPYAVSYYHTPDGIHYSLRSDNTKQDVDVSEVAKRFGGGGHRSAAGFIANAS